MIPFKTFRRLASAFVAAAVASTAPGFAAYAAAAEVVRMPVSASEGPRAIALPFAGASAAMTALPTFSAPSLGAAFLPDAAPSAS
ncbi:MAG: hypothetical protein KGL74_10375, partial [Elusimicrobia bacterium]|nr:hypothetical protein [Elusimicrobiota bacterium]